MEVLLISKSRKNILTSEVSERHRSQHTSKEALRLTNRHLDMSSYLCVMYMYIYM